MPNRFAIGIQGDQLSGVREYFKGRQLATPDLYPMVRGRLVSINDRAVSPADYAEERARRLAEREFNLSWTDRARPDNRIVAGRFWDAGTEAREFSMEEGIAKVLHVQVGDRIAFEVAGARFEAPVTSLRKVDWDSFKPNFFVIASPPLLKEYPASWITSFHLDPGHEDVIDGLVQRWPNVSVIDLSQIMAQVQRITDQVSRAVEFVFVFAILSGLVVLFAAITASQDERVFEGAILRTLGASRRQLTILQLAEFLAIGTLAGAVAAVGAVALAAVLADRVLGIPYDFHPLLPLAGLAVGALGVAVAGLVGTRRVVDAPPLQTIRDVG
jgi:putative ABC transport system permease protein